MLVKRAARAVWIGERIGGAEGGRVLAPHVAGEIARLGDLGFADVEQIIRRLTPGQLSGMEVLPRVLPLSPALRDQYAPLLEAAGPAGRRLLLTAALCTSDRFDVVLAAAATDPAVLLAKGVEDLLLWENGRYEFASPVARAAVLHGLSTQRVPAHRALARAHRQRGDVGRSAWHAAHIGDGAPEGTVRELMRFGERLLVGGSADAAYRAGRIVARDADASLSARGRLLMGRAAAALGCFEEAAAILGTFHGTSHQEAASPVLAASVSHLRGVLPGEEAVPALSRLTALLRAFEATNADREAIAGIEAIRGIWGDDDEVDAIQARLVMTNTGSRRAWPWKVTDGALSPIIDGYLRGQQAALLIISGEPDSAATAVRDSLCRLPMTHLGGGVIASGLRMLRHAAPELWTGFAGVLARVRPTVPVRIEPGYRLAAPRLSAVASRLDRDAGMRARLGSALTARENEIAELVAEGLKNREIGERLGIAGRTVEIHLGRIFRKLSIGSRAELIALVVRRQVGRAG
ncbi:DNA-binding CsgD family transcriptional regulator [Microbacterium resistens]|uniref:DNA-binding CsgD family transcriptional regulator n=1 Tax=Microbacterium resistens TaxID=156977 RepID=A0ABU1SB80_9MICO|nr:helix-turn-helix transcriptional regulator [Microbacterium resistens]MDR6866875.1 DNA-binding CsgD family transcriptional regulator [Microbacterium resistens]